MEAWPREHAVQRKYGEASSSDVDFKPELNKLLKHHNIAILFTKKSQILTNTWGNKAIVFSCGLNKIILDVHKFPLFSPLRFQRHPRNSKLSALF